MQRKIVKILGVAAVVLLLSIVMAGAVSAEDEIQEIEVEEFSIEEDDNLLEGGNFSSANPLRYYLKVADNALKYSTSAEGPWNNVETITINSVTFYKLNDNASYQLIENINLTGLYNLYINPAEDSESTTTLDLNGYVLKGTGTGSVITIGNKKTGGILTNYGNLTLVDSNSKFQRHYFTVNGDGLWVWNNDATTSAYSVCGGVITGGLYSSGGGVYCNTGSKFTMSGGNIVGNVSNESGGGGGVRCGDRCSFTINGGNIVGNVSKLSGGGGVRGSTDCSIIMNGGSIVDNTAKTFGGGVRCSNGCSFTIYGGTISGNIASTNGGGIYVEGMVTVGGTAKITGNVSGTSGSLKTNNLFLFGGKKVGLDKENVLTTGARIGVTPSGKQVSSNYTPDSENYFVSDNHDKYVTKDSQNNYLVTENGHGHDGWMFTAFNKTTKLPDTSGSYYLTGNVTIDSTWIVPSGTTINLCLNGHVIQKTGTGSAITIQNNATLNLYDCCGDVAHGHKFTVDETTGLWSLNEEIGTNTVGGGVITGGNGNGPNGSGVYVDGSGTFTMTGGNIVGNTNLSDGGGVLNHGTFTLNYGNIVGNTSSCGGGVFVNENSKFTMNDGNIVGNIVGNTNSGGGGVLNAGTFTMNGGSISGNIAQGGDALGGGVLNAGTFTMNDGSIIGNTASSDGGGVYHSGSMTVGGTAKITGNKKGTDVTNNLYLPNGKTITLSTEQPLVSGAAIGVTTANIPDDSNPVNVTLNYPESTFPQIAWEKFFTSDKGYYVCVNNMKVVLSKNKIYTVMYFRNGADSGTAPIDTGMYRSGDDATIKGNSGDLAKVDYSFGGWTKNADGTGTIYREGNTITLDNSNVVLYAKWNYSLRYEVVIPPSVKIESAPVNYQYGIIVTNSVTGNKNIRMTLKESTNNLKLVHTLDSTLKIPYSIKRITPDPVAIVVGSEIIAAPENVAGTTSATLQFTKDAVETVAGSYIDILTFKVEIV